MYNVIRKYCHIILVFLLLLFILTFCLKKFRQHLVYLFTITTIYYFFRPKLNGLVTFHRIYYTLRYILLCIYKS
jgi:hypothetical protein